MIEGRRLITSEVRPVDVVRIAATAVPDHVAVECLWKCASPVPFA